MKKRKLKKKAKPDTRKWVVYFHRRGHRKSGVHHVQVDVVGKTAFVRARNDTADVLPAENIFATEEAANKYFAGRGTKKWAIVESKNYNTEPHTLVPVLVQATEVHQNTDFPTDIDAFVVNALTGEALSSFRHKIFDTKREALAAYKKKWMSDFEEVERELDGWNKYKRNLLAVSPFGDQSFAKMRR